jgi:peptidyl-prolyl cis-trans isomerase A (cyclophilin A)
VNRAIALLAAIAIVAPTACRQGTQGAQSALRQPNSDTLGMQSPDSFRVAFQTSKGRFVIQAHRAWSPKGADRFYYLATHGYYDGVKFFRNVPDFMVQFGIHGDPQVNDVWQQLNIPDDPVKHSNLPGTVTYAMGGPNTRTVQIFINKKDNSRLDPMGFAPFGLVVEGMDVVRALNEEYGEAPPAGVGPDQGRIQAEGNAYLNRWFPRLDSVLTARVITN